MLASTVCLVVLGIVTALVCAPGLGVSPAHAASAATHPLEPLSASEFQRTYALLRGHFAARGLPTGALLFARVALNEPPKALVRAWSEGGVFPREAAVHVLHYPSNRFWVVIVDLVADRVTSVTLQPRGTQPPLTLEEVTVAGAIVQAHEPWRAAMRRRGLDPDLVYVDVWAPGEIDVEPRKPPRKRDPRARLVRALSFHRGAPIEAFDPALPQNPYARPIEGVVVTVDLNRRRVVDMTDTLVRPVSTDTGNAAVKRPALKPLRLLEPEGSNISITGRRVSWQGWRFYAVLSPREGLVLHDVRYDDEGQSRPVAYRLSLAEIYVPYGVPDVNWVFRSALDVGEYNLGTTAQTLEVDRDVPANARFLDAVFASSTGPSPDNPTGTVEYRSTVALYERHAGILWTRTDPTNAVRDTRLGRELVVTWNAWVGNYVYSFDWIFKMDASIEIRVGATGTLLGRGAADTDEPTAPPVGIDAHGTRVRAGVHQHFLSYRLDLDVDGPDNAVSRSDMGPLAAPGFRHAFAVTETAVAREGFDDVNPASARTWHIRSASRRNALGEPTAYELIPGETAVPYSSPDFVPLVRAAFATRPLWVTRYAEGELYAAGDFPNQGPAGPGLPAFITPPEDLDPAGRGSDVVIWYTAGFSHAPRPEDHPVMPTESIGFRLVPHGFFARNPALDVHDRTPPAP
jgi:primary-amine oxidase